MPFWYYDQSIAEQLIVELQKSTRCYNGESTECAFSRSVFDISGSTAVLDATAQIEKAIPAELALAAELQIVSGYCQAGVSAQGNPYYFILDDFIRWGWQRVTGFARPTSKEKEESGDLKGAHP